MTTDTCSSRRWPYLLILLTIAVVWGKTITFDFVWDDKYFVTDLQSIRSLRHVPQMFYSLEAQSSYPEGFVLFRPLRTLHYAVLYQLGGGGNPKPWLFHLANLLWHTAAASLFYAIAFNLFSRLPGRDGPPLKAQLLALFSALAFAVNPVVSETVCWVKSLDDLMATTFTLATALMLLGSEGAPGRRQYGWALGLFILAVYSKISAVPFAVFAVFLFRFLQGMSWRQSLRYGSGFAAVAAVFVIHHHLVIGHTSQTAPISGSYGQTLIDMFPVVSQYARLLCGIPPFFIDYSFMPGGHAPWSGPVLLGLAVLAMLALVAVWTVRQPSLRLVGLGLIWVGLFLLPVSNLLPMMQYMAERFLYLPLVGWVLGISTLLWWSTRWRLTAGLFGVVLAMWAVVAWERSSIWRDEVTLFVRSSRSGPRTPRVEENAVAAIFDLPRVQRVFAREKTSAKSFVPIARAETTAEDWNAAAQTLEYGYQLFPENINLINALGVAHASAGRAEIAARYFAEAVRREPDSALFLANLGQAQFEAGKFAEARQTLQKAAAKLPEHIRVWQNLGAVCWELADYAAAAECFRKLEQLDPSNPDHRHWSEEAASRMRAGP